MDIHFLITRSYCFIGEQEMIFIIRHTIRIKTNSLYTETHEICEILLSYIIQNQVNQIMSILKSSESWYKCCSATDIGYQKKAPNGTDR